MPFRKAYRTNMENLQAVSQLGECRKLAYLPFAGFFTSGFSFKNRRRSRVWEDGVWV